MAPHSSTLAWKIPWMEEPGRLQSMGPLRVRHDWATSLSLFTFMHWRRKWQPTPVFLPGESLLSMGSHRVGHDWSDLAKKESEVAQSFLTFWDPMDCSLPCSSIHGIFQARVLEWVAISFARGFSWPRDQTRVSHIVGRRFTIWATTDVLKAVFYSFDI